MMEQPESPVEKKKRLRDYTYFTPTIFFLGAVCVAIAFYYFLNNMAGASLSIQKTLTLLTPFILGGVIAYLLNPLVIFVERKGKKWIGNKTLLRGVAMFIAYALVIFSIWVLFAVVFPQISESFEELIEILIVYFNQLSDWIINWINTSDLKEYLTKEQIDQITRQVEGGLGEVFELAKKFIPWVINLTGSITNTVFNGFLGLMVSIYLLFGKEKLGAQIKKTIHAWLPPFRAEGLLRFLRLSDRIFNSFVVGNIIDSLVVGVLCFVIMALFQIPYALLISILAGVTNIIPYFGPFIGAVPSVLILLTVSPGYAFAFCVIILVIQQVDGNIIKPLILGDSMGLSGIWILASVTIGGGLFGITGMLLGVPLCAIAYATFVTWSNNRLEGKGLSTALVNYELSPPPEKEKKDKKWSPRKK